MSSKVDVVSLVGRLHLFEKRISEDMQNKAFLTWPMIAEEHNRFLSSMRQLGNKELLTTPLEPTPLSDREIAAMKRDGMFDSYHASLYSEAAYRVRKWLSILDPLVPSGQKKVRRYGCFISDKRQCQAEPGKSRDLVFIASSGDKEFKADIEAILHMLGNEKLTGYFSLYSGEEIGLDAFCDKICSKIIESRFCIVALNNPYHVQERGIQFRTPSANVYFEYGLMTALGKEVVPIIRDDMLPPFDVRHIDITFYSSVDLASKVARVIRSKKEKTELA
jgi:hypothetical protein